MNWENAGILKASLSRRKILELLSKCSMTPKEIAQQSKLHLSQVSRGLREMEKRNMVKCMTPNLKRGRIYVVTEEGREALKIAGRGH